MKQRKVPLRKCTGCQEMKNKKELIRIVRNDAGEFALDRTGKLPGRGAYICPNAECLAKAQKSKGLERSFKVAVPKEVYEQLLQQAVRKKQAFLLILAQDASKNTKKKFTNSAVYYELPLAEIGTKEELGRAIGAEMRSIIAITEKGFAKKLKELADDNIENRTKVGEG